MPAFVKPIKNPSVIEVLTSNGGGWLTPTIIYSLFIFSPLVWLAVYLAVHSNTLSTTDRNMLLASISFIGISGGILMIGAITYSYRVNFTMLLLLTSLVLTAIVAGNNSGGVSLAPVAIICGIIMVFLWLNKGTYSVDELLDYNSTVGNYISKLDKVMSHNNFDDSILTNTEMKKVKDRRSYLVTYLSDIKENRKDYSNKGSSKYKDLSKFLNEIDNEILGKDFLHTKLGISDNDIKEHYKTDRDIMGVSGGMRRNQPALPTMPTMSGTP